MIGDGDTQEERGGTKPELQYPSARMAGKNGPLKTEPEDDADADSVV